MCAHRHFCFAKRLSSGANTFSHHRDTKNSCWARSTKDPKTYSNTTAFSQGAHSTPSTNRRDTQIWRASVCVLIDTFAHRPLTEETLRFGGQVFVCSSTLLFRQKAQLWCQHFFSSRWFELSHFTIFYKPLQQHCGHCTIGTIISRFFLCRK